MWTFRPHRRTPSYYLLLPRGVCAISQRLYRLVTSKFTTSIVQPERQRQASDLYEAFLRPVSRKRWHAFLNENKVLGQSRKSGRLVFPPRMHLNGRLVLPAHASSKTRLSEDMNAWHGQKGERLCRCKQHFLSHLFELDISSVCKKDCFIWNRQRIWISFRMTAHKYNDLCECLEPQYSTKGLAPMH